MFIRLSLFVTLVLRGQSEFPSILPFTLYSSIQDKDVCLFKMFFKEIFWIILFFLFINFFGSVNRLPCYLVSLELSILHKHLKQVMDNNYHLEAGSIFLRVKITLILSWAKLLCMENVYDSSTLSFSLYNCHISSPQKKSL